MTRRFHLGAQLLALAGQMLIPAVPGITPEWERFLHQAVAFGQAALGVLAHHFNPDGTKAV